MRLDGVSILEDVTATVPRGSCTAIIGPNGAGKTTLLLAMLGHVHYKGTIALSGSLGRRCRIGYVPQKLNLDRGLPITVAEFLASAHQRKPLWFGISGSLSERAMQALRMVGGEALASKALGSLSGGELQRALLAFALLDQPELLVLDEPTAGMDVQGEAMFCSLLDHLRSRHGFTELMVSHDIAAVTHHATHVICLNRRLVAEGAPREVLSPDNLALAFGIHMGMVNPNALGDGQPSSTDLPDPSDPPCCAHCAPPTGDAPADA